MDTKKDNASEASFNFLFMMEKWFTSDQRIIHAGAVLGKIASYAANSRWSGSTEALQCLLPRMFIGMQLENCTFGARLGTQ